MQSMSGHKNGKCLLKSPNVTMAFNSRAVLPSYRVGTTNVLWVEETRHLGVTCSKILGSINTSEKVDKASRILGTIKHTIRTAPEKVDYWPILAFVDR